MKILILFAHPALHKSSINRELIKDLDKMDSITFHDLYEFYPDYDIDIRDEQKLLLAHDCIIFMHPMYWYSTPAILKEWMDLVLTHGWAYGSTGTALKGKLFFNAITTGGPRQAFSPGGLHKHTVAELLVPLRLTARRCGMINLPPFVVHGTYAMEKAELNIHRENFLRILELLINGDLNQEKTLKLDYLNDYQ